MAIEFLNADLEITSDEPLDVIRDAFSSFGHRFFELYCGEQSHGVFFASFEAHPEKEHSQDIPDDCHSTSSQDKIKAFCEAIEGFSVAAKDLWLRSGSRVIDLGYQADDLCSPFHDSLDTATLQRLASLDIRLAVTIYPKTISHQTKPNKAVEATG